MSNASTSSVAADKNSAVADARSAREAETLPMRRGRGLVVIDPPDQSGTALTYSSMLPPGAEARWNRQASCRGYAGGDG